MKDGTVWDDPAEAPILVLGSGQRCGSTLVQRLLTSHPGVLVWGEHGGELAKLLTMHYDLLGWDGKEAEEGRKHFQEGGYDGWIANLLPGRQPLVDAGRAYLLAWLAAPAAERGRPRWGFKEVRFVHQHAAALHELFPGLTCIHITRDPRDILVSLDAWERAGGWLREYTIHAIELWAEVTRSFLDAPPEPWILSRRYEDVVADPGTFIAETAALLGTEAASFDATVFERKVHSGGSGRRKLKRFRSIDRDLRALLDHPQVAAIAARAGYG